MSGSEQARARRVTARWASIVLAGACVLCRPGPASAQEADAEVQRASAAQGLFDQAVAEMKQNDFASACPKLEEVTRLVPDALGSKIELAQCYERWGRTASAWLQWTRVETLAARKNQADRRARAGARAAALLPRVARLTVEVPSEVARIPGLEVRRGPVVMGSAQWGSALPIDVGEHSLVVSAPGYEPFRGTVVVRADGEAVRVKVPALERKARPAVAVEAGGNHAAEGEPAKEPIRDAPTWQRPLGIGAVVAGGAGLVLGGVLGALAIGKNADSNEVGRCTEATNRCTDAGLDLRSSAVTLATGSTIAFVAGGVLAAGGLVLWFTAPSARERSGARRASASAAFGPQGVWLAGQF